MTSNRTITRVVVPAQVIEGAGVRLRRSFPVPAADHFDPFLLLDDFSSNNPVDFVRGFPWHPHRGIETMTYILDGLVKHSDSLGNTGTIGPGESQWMTAGSGIMHEEMPQPGDGRLKGFQLWVNLPAAKKMSPPLYRDVSAASIPVVHPKPGVTLRVVAGSAGGVRGPVTGIAVDPLYLDVELAPRAEFSQPAAGGHTALMYLFEGAVQSEAQGGAAPVEVTARSLAIFSGGDRIALRASNDGARGLLIAGKPLDEPIARSGSGNRR
jgi:redox-sensitive bicupin YhaK (pirin superfamily)